MTSGKWYDRIAARIFLHYFLIEDNDDKNKKQKELIQQITKYTANLDQKMKLLYLAYQYEFARISVINSSHYSLELKELFSNHSLVDEIFELEDAIIFKDILKKESDDFFTGSDNAKLHHYPNYIKHLNDFDMNENAESIKHCSSRFEIVILINLYEEMCKKFYKSQSNIIRLLELDKAKLEREVAKVKMNVAAFQKDKESYKQNEEEYNKKDAEIKLYEEQFSGSENGWVAYQGELIEKRHLIKEKIDAYMLQPKAALQDKKIVLTNLPFNIASIMLVLLERLCRITQEALQENPNEMTKIEISDFPIEEFLLPSLYLATHHVYGDTGSLSFIADFIFSGIYDVDKIKQKENTKKLSDFFVNACSILEYNIEVKKEDLINLFARFKLEKDEIEVNKLLKDFIIEDVNASIEFIDENQIKANDDENFLQKTLFCDQLFQKIKRKFGELDIDFRKRVFPMLEEAVKKITKIPDLIALWDFINTHVSLKSDGLYQGLARMGLYKANPKNNKEPITLLMVAMREKALQFIDVENNLYIKKIKILALEKIISQGIDDQTLKTFKQLNPHNKIESISRMRRFSI